MTLLERLRDAGEARAAAREAQAETVIDPDVDVPYRFELTPALADRLRRYLEREIPTFRVRFAAEVGWLRLATLSTTAVDADAAGPDRGGAAGHRPAQTDCPNCAAPGTVTRIDLTFGTAWVVCADCGFRWGIAVDAS